MNTTSTVRSNHNKRQHERSDSGGGSDNCKRRPPFKEFTPQQKHENARAYALGLPIPHVLSEEEERAREEVNQAKEGEERASERVDQPKKVRYNADLLRANYDSLEDQRQAAEEKRKIPLHAAIETKGGADKQQQPKNNAEYERLRKKLESMKAQRLAREEKRKIAKQNRKISLQAAIEKERRRRVQAKKKTFLSSKKKIRRREEKKILSYRFPESFGEWSRHCKFISNLDDIMLGKKTKFNILYHHGYCGEDEESRLVYNSTLTLEFDNRNDKNEIVGKAVFDDDKENSSSHDTTTTDDNRHWAFCTDFFIRDPEDDEQYRIVPSSDTCEEGRMEQFNGCFSEAYVCGFHEVTDRVALPWTSTELYDPEAAEEIEEDDLYPYFPIENIEEADKHMEVYKNGHGKDDWLCRHTLLTPELAKYTHDFVAWKPCPVFFLEPGDLILSIHLCEDEFGERGARVDYVLRYDVEEGIAAAERVDGEGGDDDVSSVNDQDQDSEDDEFAKEIQKMEAEVNQSSK